MCNIYLAFSYSKAYQCFKSTKHNTLSEILLHVISLKVCHHLHSKSRGILDYLFLYSEDSCLSLLNIANYMYRFWPFHNQHATMSWPHLRNGKTLLMKQNMDFPEIKFCFVPALRSQQGTIIVGVLTAGGGGYNSPAYQTPTKALWGPLLLLPNTSTSQSKKDTFHQPVASPKQN